MSTFLAQFVDSEIKVRFKEPYITAGLNEKLVGIVPRGIHRGFRLAPGVSNYELKIEADPETSDHVVQYETGTGYSLRIRKTGGDFNLDLTSIAGNKVFVIAIYAQYVFNSDTSAVIRAYELSPTDEFTIAPELDELAVLGEVTLTSTPAPIVLADLDEKYRSSPWEVTSRGIREADQIVQNGDFSLCSDDSPSAGEILWPCWDYPGVTETGVSFQVVSTGSPQIGFQHLALTLTGAGSQIGVLPYEGLYRVRERTRVKASVAVKHSSLTPGPGSSGHLGLRVRAYASNPSTVLSTYYIDNLSPGTSYADVIDAFCVPAGTHWISVDVYFDDDGASSTGTIYFDNVRVWLEQPDLVSGRSESSLPLHAAAMPVRSLDIAPSPGVYASLEAFLDKLLTLRHDSGDVYLWQKRRDAGNFLLNMPNGRLDLSGTIASAAEGASARITSTYPDAGVAKYVLLWEATRSSGVGVRLYVSDADVGSEDGFVLTVNALWNGSQWVRDYSATSSYYRLSSGHLSMYTYSSSDPSPWNDSGWGTPGVKNLEFPEDSRGKGTMLWTGSVYLGTRLINDATDAETPRIDTDVALDATSTYTLIWRGSMLSSDPYIRLYSGSDGLRSESVLVFTVNAEFESSADTWSRDNDSFDSMRLDISNGRLNVMLMDNAESNGWDDTDWESISTATNANNLLTTRYITTGGPGNDVTFNNALLTLCSLNTGPAGNRYNPLYNSVPISHTLYSCNMVKAWARFTITPSATVAINDGFNISSIAADANHDLVVDLALAMANTNYSVVCLSDDSYQSGAVWQLTDVGTRTATQFQLRLYDPSGSVLNIDALPGGEEVHGTLIVVGRSS